MIPNFLFDYFLYNFASPPPYLSGFLLSIEIPIPAYFPQLIWGFFFFKFLKISNSMGNLSRKSFKNPPISPFFDKKLHLIKQLYCL